MVFGRDHGHILKTFTQLGTSELRHRPMGATEEQSTRGGGGEAAGKPGDSQSRI